MLHWKKFENSGCFGQHFARFHGGERECRVVKRRGKLPPSGFNDKL